MKRFLSLVLSLVIAFSIIPTMDISVFASDEFSANKYLAQLSFGDEYIPYQTLESFYFDFETGCETVVEAAQDTSLESDIAAWYAVKSVANPGNTLDALNYQQQYEVILYNVVFDALCSEQVEQYNYENSISKVSEFTNTVVEGWNSADILDKTDLTGAESEAVKDAAMTFLGKSDTKWTALGEYAAIVNEAAVCIESIMEISVDVIEIIDRVSIMVQLMDVGDAVISFLYDIKANANDLFLASAAQEVIDSMANDWMGLVSKVVTDVGFSFGKIATERLANLAWAKVCAVSPFCTGMVIGDVVGTAACNALFATEDTIEEYSNMKKFIEVMSATRAAFSSTASACGNNINDETAAKWLFSCDFMYSLIVSDYKCSVKFFEIVSTKGLVNKVSNLFGGDGYEKYESFCDSVNGILKNYKNVYESFYTSWPFYMEEDYPDVYAAYLQKMNNPFETIITEVTSVDFLKTEYELAMNQTVKIPAMAYPTTAKNTNLTYSSSNTNVISVASDGTITPVGEGTANVIATANNGVQGSCEITVYPYNVSWNENGYTIDEYVGSSTEVETPSEINNIDVTTIGDNSFYANTTITSVIIPGSVTNIGELAFRDCTNLTSISIPDSVKCIGKQAFYNCISLEKIEWNAIDASSSCLGINGNVFFNAGESGSGIEVVFGDDVETIPSYLFYANVDSYHPKITSVTLSDSVTKIGHSAFGLCKNIVSVNINNLEAWCNIDFDGSGSNPLSEGSEQVQLFLNGSALAGHIVIPESVTAVPEYTFINSQIESITILDNVTSIGAYTFSNCTSLMTITIPDSVTSIGGGAFSNCTSLTTITIPDDVTSIGNNAFKGCESLNNITLPDNITKIGRGTFRDCIALEKITIPNGVTHIERTAFHNCTSLSEVILPETLIVMGDRDNIFGGFAFASNDDMNKLGVFSNCTSLEKINIPPSIEYICNFAFKGCTQLESIIIPDSIIELGGAVFYKCSSLTSVKLSENLTTLASYSTVIDDDGLFELCSNLSTITIPDSITNIEAAAFRGCVSLETITIPDSVKTIGKRAFGDCTNLKEVTIGKNVETIGSAAFSYCPSLKKVTFDKCVPSLSEPSNFSHCENLSEVHITDMKTWCEKEHNYLNPLEIAGNLYLNGVLVKKLDIPSGTTIVNNYAFYGCTSIENIEIPNSVTSIGDSAFSSCDSLNSVTIPGNVYSIGSESFNYCSSLSTVILEDGVESIGANAFARCPALSKIVIPKSVETIDVSAFTNSNDTTIYCDYNSYAHTFAVDNNISYVLNTNNTNVDITNNIICTDILGGDMSDIVFCSENFTYTIDTTYAGTGSVVDIMKDGELHSQYTLVVEGDTNGDSVCDALDAAQVAKASNGHTTLDGAYAMAADSNSDDMVDVTDYQSIVNKAIA